MSLLLFIPGSPIIYYGDEIMMEGGQDPDCRRGMIFDNYNPDILKMVKKLIKIKHFEPVREGDISVSKLGENVLKITRFTLEETINMVLNFGEEIKLIGLENKYDLISETTLNGKLNKNQFVIYK